MIRKITISLVVLVSEHRKPVAWWEPYRDGSYDYYMSEPIRDNDPKAVGPFIMACLMLGK